MLSPKKFKWRKHRKGRIKGKATRGTLISFGDFALLTTEPGRITARQLEAGRIAINRYVKRGGKLMDYVSFQIVQLPKNLLKLEWVRVKEVLSFGLLQLNQVEFCSK